MNVYRVMPIFGRFAFLGAKLTWGDYRHYFQILAKCAQIPPKAKPHANKSIKSTPTN